jgi:phage terminase small subunit
MPRRSAASMAVVSLAKGGRTRLAPSEGAPDEVRAIFVEVVRSAPADHFVAADAPLVEAFAEAILLARQASLEMAAHGPVVGGRASPWLTVQEKAHRALVALSARLRLAPQSRADARSAGRRANEPRPSIYDSMRDDGDV